MEVFGVVLKQRKQVAIIFSMILFVVGNLPQVFAHGGVL